MVIQTDMDSKRPSDQRRYLSKSAEQSSEPGCGLKTVTLPLLYIARCPVFVVGALLEQSSPKQIKMCEFGDFIIVRRTTHCNTKSNAD